MPGAEQVSVLLPADVLARVDRAVYARRRTKSAGRPSRSSVIATLVAQALSITKPEERS